MNSQVSEFNLDNTIQAIAICLDNCGIKAGIITDNMYRHDVHNLFEDICQWTSERVVQKGRSLTHIWLRFDNGSTLEWVASHDLRGCKFDLILISSYFKQLRVYDRLPTLLLLWGQKEWEQMVKSSISENDIWDNRYYLTRIHPRHTVCKDQLDIEPIPDISALLC